MGKKKNKPSQVISIELAPVTSSKLQPLTKKEEEEHYENIVLRKLITSHQNGNFAKIVNKLQKTFNGQTVAIHSDTHAIKVAKLFAKEAKIDIQDPLKGVPIYMTIEGYCQSIKANYNTAEKIINELIKEPHNKQFWMRFYESCFYDNGSNKEIFITVIRDHPEACKYFFSPTTIAKDHKYLENLCTSDPENAAQYKKIMELFLELELIQPKAETVPLQEMKEEKEEKDDSLIALKKIYDMTHKNTTALPDQAEIDKLESVSRDENFWKLIRDGFSHGKAKLFLTNLQKYGAYTKLFPPILSQSMEEQAQNDDWVLASLSEIDAYRESYSSNMFKSLYQRAPIAMMILFVKELPVEPNGKQLTDVFERYQIPQECKRDIAMWYRYTNAQKHQFLEESSRNLSTLNTCVLRI